MTKQEMKDRIELLASEIDANEEENRVMQEEINNLYAKIDAGDFELPDPTDADLESLLYREPEESGDDSLSPKEMDNAERAAGLRGQN